MKSWKMRNLTFEGKTTVFKSLALSKIFFLAQALLISKEVISAVEKVQRVFIWHDRSPKKKRD